MQNKIPEGWIDETLLNLSEYINRGVTPSYSSEGTIVINQKCIRNGKLTFDESRYTDSTIKKIPVEKYLKLNDILICSTGVGTLGRVAQVDKLSKDTTVDSHVTIVRIKEAINSKFMGFLLRNFEDKIESLAEGSTGQTELPRLKLGNLSILLPTLSEQNKIADILSSFDNKIELLKEQNKTLESIAQTVFKEWFVKFNFPGSTGKMIDSGLGSIPEGWKVGQLDEFCNLQGGYAYKSSDFAKDSNYLVIKIKNIQNNVVNIQDGDCLIDLEGIRTCNKFGLVSGNVLVAMTGGDIGKVGLVQKADKNLLLNQRVGRFIDTIAEGSVFAYYAYQVLDFENRLKQLGEGGSAAQPNFSTKNFNKLKIIVPNDKDNDLITKYIWTVKPLFEKNLSNLYHIRTLSILRDSLLPKLMNGEIRIS